MECRGIKTSPSLTFVCTALGCREMSLSFQVLPCACNIPIRLAPTSFSCAKPVDFVHFSILFKLLDMRDEFKCPPLAEACSRAWSIMERDAFTAPLLHILKHSTEFQSGKMRTFLLLPEGYHGPETIFRRQLQPPCFGEKHSEAEHDPCNDFCPQDQRYVSDIFHILE